MDVEGSCIGVCSWSLKPASPEDLVRKVRATGLSAVQLALGPLLHGWPVARTAGLLADAGIAVRSGMIGMRGEDYRTPATIRDTGGVRLDAHWPENLAAARAAAALAWRLRLPLVSFHAGFLPHDRADPLRAVMLGRLATLADVFADHGVAVALETGQERADTLLDVLAELARPAVGVNFDPANMLLYGTGEPVAALAALLAHVRQVHVKDARPPREPGAWGEEVPVGEGAVDWPAFFAVLAPARVARRLDLMLEREAGSDRTGDVRRGQAFAHARLADAGTNRVAEPR